MRMKTRDARSRAGRTLVVVLLAVAMLGGVAAVHASWPGGAGLPPVSDGWTPGDTGGTLVPPRAPLDAQKCMDDLLSNQRRCKLVHCTWLFWYPIDCDHSALAGCHLAAEQVFDCCMKAGFGCD